MSRLAPWLLLLLALPAGAVIIDGPDGAANTAPPPDDPGLAHVGDKQGLTAVYIGKQWVLTAAHVPIGPVVLGGVTYDYQRDSKIPLQPEGGASLAPDLAMFRIYPEPPLPDLPIRETPLSVELPVTMVGNGADRGEPTTWMGLAGWLWAGPHSIRWGTNAIHELHPGLVINNRQTDSFSTEFTQFVGPDECQAANGDSGGAVFVKNGGTWELAGIMHSIEVEPGQPAAALYTNWTYAANLSIYRDQILAIRDAPEIPALPVAGVPLLGVLFAASSAGWWRGRPLR